MTTVFLGVLDGRHVSSVREGLNFMRLPCFLGFSISGALPEGYNHPLLQTRKKGKS
jgi:hypothetical protein